MFGSGQSLPHPSWTSRSTYLQLWRKKAKSVCLGFFKAKNLVASHLKKQTNIFIPAFQSLLWWKRIEEQKWIVCGFLNQRMTLNWELINILRTENRPVAYRNVRKLDKKLYLEKWFSKSVLIHSGKINPKKLVFNRKDKPGKENLKTITRT